MKRVLCHRGIPLFLSLIVLLSCSCVKQFSPDHAMSGPKITGETKVRELMESRDLSLVQETVTTRPMVDKVTVPVKLTLKEAVLTGLEHNQNFLVERLKPTISRSTEEVERAAFDPLFTAKASHGHGPGYLSDGTDTWPLRQAIDRETTSSGVSLSQTTSLGATITLNADQEKETVPDTNDSSRQQQNWDLTVTQALLRGRGPDVTLARLRQSRLDTEMSLYELQGTAETLAANIEQAYWNLVLAERNVTIYQQSVSIASQQLEEVLERIRVGALAENEAASAEAEAAERYQQLVSARGTLAKAKLNLLHLVNPGGQADWQAEITLSDPPELSDMSVDAVDQHVALAMSKRADLNQARLLVRRNNLEVIQTKNGLLPKLDLFLSLGGSRYTYSFAGHDDMTTNDNAYAGGLSLEFPLRNREAKAKHVAAGWSLEQANAALSNMEQLVQVEVRSAHVDVEQASAQVKAATATATLRERALALEQEKFRLGRSTTIQVAQAQRDLVESQILQSEAVVGARKAMLDLHRLEGSLLPHLGIAP